MDFAVTQSKGKRMARGHRMLLAALAGVLMATGLVVSPASTPAAEARACGLHSYRYQMTTLYSANHYMKVTNCNSYVARYRVAFDWAQDGPCLSYQPFGGTRSLWYSRGYSSGPYLVRC